MKKFKNIVVSAKEEIKNENSEKPFTFTILMKLKTGFNEIEKRF